MLMYLHYYIYFFMVSSIKIVPKWKKYIHDEDLFTMQIEATSSFCQTNDQSMFLTRCCLSYFVIFVKQGFLHIEASQIDKSNLLVKTVLTVFKWPHWSFEHGLINVSNISLVDGHSSVNHLDDVKSTYYSLVKILWQDKSLIH